MTTEEIKKIMRETPLLLTVDSPELRSKIVKIVSSFKKNYQNSNDFINEAEDILKWINKFQIEL